MTENVRKSDKYIPLYFVAFFIVIFIIDGTFVYMATSTHRGVVTQNAYEKGLRYNDTVQAVSSQQKLGWQSSISMQGDALVFGLRDMNGNPIRDAEVTAYFSRPTQAGMDTQYVMTNDKQTYLATVKLPVKGQWDVKISAVYQQKQYQAHKRIVIE